MALYTRLRWKVDNLERFKRQLFVRRRFLLEEYIQEDLFFYRKGKVRKTGYREPLLVKLKVIGNDTYVQLKVFRDDPMLEVYEFAEVKVPSFQDAKEFLALAGFVSGEYYQKKVSKYILKNEFYTHNYVEEYKWGMYIKVVAGIDAITRVGGKLGFALDDRTKDDYRDEYRKYLLSHGLKVGHKLVYK